MLWFSFLTKRLKNRSDSEHEQALLRILLQTVFLICFFITDIPMGYLLCGIYLHLSFALLIAIIVFPKQNPRRRIIGILVDISGLSLGLYFLGEVGAAVFAGYTFIIIGNGFRYGRKYLLSCMALTVISAFTACFLNPFWFEHLWLTSAGFLTFTIVPLYALGFLKQIHHALHQAEAGNQAKAQFIANMSHELRTPVHGIIGLLGMLSKNDQYLHKEDRNYLNLARHSSELLQLLIDDILDLSKIEADKIKTTHSQFNLPELLQNTLTAFAMQANNKKIAFMLFFEKVPKLIIYDATHLRQILLNIVGNAVKFTDQGHIHVNISFNHHILTISVADTGIGIEEKNLSSLFDPFVQLAEDTDRKGTGLGSTISQRLARIAGGDIQVQSKIGQGSRFTITLPAKAVGTNRLSYTLNCLELTHKQHNKPPPVKRIQKFSILIAEDNAVARLIAERRFYKLGIKHIETAQHGLEALDKFQANNYDLLLTDIRMPKLDGIELTRRIRKYEKKHHLAPIYIVGLSAHAMEDVVQECLAAGMDDFVSKPINFDTLLHKLDQKI